MDEVRNARYISIMWAAGNLFFLWFYFLAFFGQTWWVVFYKTLKNSELKKSGICQPKPPYLLKM
jgi:hypothetical protein